MQVFTLNKMNGRNNWDKHFVGKLHKDIIEPRFHYFLFKHHPYELHYRKTVFLSAIFSIQSCQTSQFTSKSSRQELFCKIDFLENFSKLTGKHLCRCLFFIKVASPYNSIKKETPTQVFLVKFGKFLRLIFL